jgi:hypothetical protein
MIMTCLGARHNEEGGGHGPLSGADAARSLV